MKKIFLTVGIISLIFISCKEDKSKKTVVTDAKKVATTTLSSNAHKVISSKLTWKGYKPSGTHSGTINLNDGVLNLKNNKLVGGKFNIDMKSIKVLDIKDAKYNADLTGHLANKDFFDTTTYPTGSFEITKVTPGEIVSEIQGNLTLKGITKSITFPATVVVNEDGVISFLSNAIKIDRTDFGIKYKSKKFFDNLKDKFVNDIFDITFDVKAAK